MKPSAALSACLRRHGGVAAWVVVGLLSSATAQAECAAYSLSIATTAYDISNSAIKACNGSSWITVTSSAGDTITSGTAPSASVLANGATGTISITTGGVAQTAYFDSTGRLVGPGVSTTGPISGKTGYFRTGVNIWPTGQILDAGSGSNAISLTVAGGFRMLNLLYLGSTYGGGTVISPH